MDLVSCVKEVEHEYDSKGETDKRTDNEGTSCKYR